MRILFRLAAAASGLPAMPQSRTLPKGEQEWHPCVTLFTTFTLVNVVHNALLSSKSSLKAVRRTCGQISSRVLVCLCVFLLSRLRAFRGTERVEPSSPPPPLPSSHRSPSTPFLRAASTSRGRSVDATCNCNKP